MQTQKLSRLELYVEILRSLETLESANLIEIQEKTNVEQAFLKRAMSFLETQGLVKKTKIDTEFFYEKTFRGDRINRYFSQKAPQELGFANIE